MACEKRTPNIQFEGYGHSSFGLSQWNKYGYHKTLVEEHIISQIYKKTILYRKT